MHEQPTHLDEANRTLARIRPWLAHEFAEHLSTPAWQEFEERLVAHFPRLFHLLVALYGDHYDLFYHLTQVVTLAAHSWLERSPDLKALDREREANPTWFQSEKMIGGVCYVDLFAGDLQALRKKIPYFKELGLTYLHLMPLFKAPEGDSDGGYAVSDYRTVDARLGTMADLQALADALRKAGISLVLDFVFNHTADEHRWAQAALAGDADHEEYYYFFPDRTMPDAYDRTLREIFPDQHPGSFSYRDENNKWVWTTFNTFQLDLNYRNPMVFYEMASEMLFLANVGCEVLRLDALAFIWKELGTSCESLPKAHQLVQAFNALLRIAAPSLLFKSEAIVHPDEVAKYIGKEECQLSYNPLLMALLWNSLATREVRLLRHAMSYRFQIPAESAWVNYIRCHDDIGWTFDDGDAGALGINGYDHRRFLNNFYTGRFTGSFARGLPFQENPKTGDARISGSLASLAGLEYALQLDDAAEIELAIRRILLLHAIIFSMGGIPLIYLGDEVGWLNDYRYRTDPAKVEDSRWVHRPLIDWAKMERRHDPDQIEGKIYQRLQQLIVLRKSTPGFGGNQMAVVPIGSDHIFAFVRTNERQRVLVLANFTEREQRVAPNELRLYGLGYEFHELISDAPLTITNEPIRLDPYQVMWLESRTAARAC
ncbi:MAG TPA: amylosucrase [Caldilineaceae bacterium]|nr:amylosucrase [Caldilineaceae bacterium]